jgi:hypothetical protein
MPESQQLALVDVHNRSPLEGIAEPVDDLGRLVPHDNDQLVGPSLNCCLEHMRE